MMEVQSSSTLPGNLETNTEQKSKENVVISENYNENEKGIIDIKQETSLNIKTEQLLNEKNSSKEIIIENESYCRNNTCFQYTKIPFTCCICLCNRKVPQHHLQTESHLAKEKIWKTLHKISTFSCQECSKKDFKNLYEFCLHSVESHTFCVHRDLIAYCKYIEKLKRLVNRTKGMESHSNDSNDIGMTKKIISKQGIFTCFFCTQFIPYSLVIDHFQTPDHIKCEDNFKSTYKLDLYPCPKCPMNKFDNEINKFKYAHELFTHSVNIHGYHLHEEFKKYLKKFVKINLIDEEKKHQGMLVAKKFKSYHFNSHNTDIIIEGGIIHCRKSFICPLCAGSKYINLYNHLHSQGHKEKEKMWRNLYNIDSFPCKKCNDYSSSFSDIYDIILHSIQVHNYYLQEHLEEYYKMLAKSSSCKQLSMFDCFPRITEVPAKEEYLIIDNRISNNPETTDDDKIDYFNCFMCLSITKDILQHLQTSDHMLREDKWKEMYKINSFPCQICCDKYFLNLSELYSHTFEIHNYNLDSNLEEYCNNLAKVDIKKENIDYTSNESFENNDTKICIKQEIINSENVENKEFSTIQNENEILIKQEVVENSDQEIVEEEISSSNTKNEINSNFNQNAFL